MAPEWGGEHRKVRLKSYPKKKIFFSVAALIISCFFIQSAFSAGTFISAPDRVDMVHDPSRNILYITSGADVLRYDLGTQQLLSPFPLGGDLKGIDLSPDGNTLAIADYTIVGMHLVDLQTGLSRKIFFSPGNPYERGSWSVAFGKDGNVIISAGNTTWVPLRKYNPATGEVAILLQSITDRAVLASSADGNIIGFAESDGSDGGWGCYRVDDANISERTGDNGTSSYNFEMGTNRNGTQFAVIAADGAHIYDTGFVHVTKLGRHDSPQPIGVVYAPSEDIVYFALTETQEVRAFETTRFTQVKSYNLEYTFQRLLRDFAYQQGRLKISRDGKLLFATVEGGVRYVRTETDATPSHTLTVQTNGAGAGAVTSSPEGIYCPSVCSRDYTSGHQATLSANPQRGSIFAGWSGAGCSGTGPCTVSIDTEKTVTATFNKGDAIGRTRFIPSPGRVDMVHDPSRNILYITSGTDVLRYDLGTQQFLPPFPLGGDLSGIDLSPDGNTLAVADYTIVGMHLVDLQTGLSRKVFFPPTGGSAQGSFSVAFCNDGNIVVTTLGGGPLRKYNPMTGKVTVPLQSLFGRVMLNSSADGNIIGFVEDYMPDGRWGRYRVTDGDAVERTGNTDGTSSNNFEIGTNRNGTQFAIPTPKGTYIYNSDFVRIATIGQQFGPRPLSAVYDPSEDIVYFAWTETQEVRAYDAKNFTKIKSYNFEQTFQYPQHPVNQAYQQGRLKISRDGVWLFATVDGGIRYVETRPWGGDIDRDGTVDLADVIMALRVSSNIPLSKPVSMQADVDGDHHIGMAEAIYDLQVLAGLRLRDNRNPILKISGNKTSYEGGCINLTVSVTDEDNDLLTVAPTSLPPGATFDAQSGVFYWLTTHSQIGAYQVTFTVTDDFGGQATETVNLVVNPYPVFRAADYDPLNVGDWITYDLHGASASGTVTATVTGTRTLGNTAIKIVSYSGGSTDYSTSDGNGVKLYGQYNPSSGMEVLFDSPLLIIPENMVLGTSHDSSSYWTLNYEGRAYRVSITAHTQYMALEDVQTENGILRDCIKVSVRYDQVVVETGQSVPGETAYYWYYNGVGIVKVASRNDTLLIRQSNVNGLIRNY